MAGPTWDTWAPWANQAILHIDVFLNFLDLGHGSRDFLKTRTQTSVICENMQLRIYESSRSSKPCVTFRNITAHP